MVIVMKKPQKDAILGDDSMSEALLEIMTPFIEPIIIIQQREAKMLEEGRREGREEGIRETIYVLRNFGHLDGEIRTVIAKRYGLSSEEVENYMRSAF